MTFDPKDFESVTCPRCGLVCTKSQLYLCEYKCNLQFLFLCADYIKEIKQEGASDEM